jgi:prepilin-type N-terminal cleavage/methylation domain-containing protein
MIHGSSVTRGYKGKRSGISLVEMLIAIVLFGVISAIGYKYYKNFYDTTLAAKKARVSAIIDQATQISNAYDIYAMQIGTVPITMASLSAVTSKILTETPAPIPEVSTTGWKIASPTALADAVGLDLDGNAAGNDVAFTYSVNGPANDSDKRDYCNILNNVEDPTWSLEALDAAILQDDGMYAAGFTRIMCYQTAANTYHFAFIKTVAP